MSTDNDQPSNPWPDVGSEPLLFLLDVGHDVERELLSDWLDKTRPENIAPEVAADRLALPILYGVKGRVEVGDLPERLRDRDQARIIPVRVVWLPPKSARQGRPRLRDLFLGDVRHPGRFAARWILRLDPRRAVCVAGASATVGELRERFERQNVSDAGGDQSAEFASFVVRQAGVTLDVAERRLQGNRYKVPRFVADALQSSVSFNQALAELAAELNRPLAELRNEAREYMDEMIARPSPFFIDWMGNLTRSFVRLGYKGKIATAEADIERTRALMRDRPTALLWTHKSHVDGPAITRVLYENDLPAPHTFGGINMAFAGAGALGRRAGAIFIRRSFTDNPVYKLVFRHYLGYLMEKRFPFSWAFEGTRSRVGKLMPPRYGLIKYVVEAARATGTENLTFIPVSISYDLIGETSDYAREQAGHKKRPESLRWFLGYVRKLRAPKGRIYMDFCEPVVIEGAVPDEDDLNIPKIAFEVAVRVNEVTPVTFPSLVCLALLAAAPRALTFAELRRELIGLILWLRRRNIRMSDNFDEGNDAELEELAQMTIDRGLVMQYDEGPDTVYGISEDQYPQASYYRNTIVHYFVNKAILELALVGVQGVRGAKRPQSFWAETERLRDLFKFEFFYAPKAEFRTQLEGELARYADDWAAILGGSAKEFKAFIASFRPLVAHATLLPYIEAYGVVADVFRDLDPETPLEEKDCIAKSLKLGQQRLLQRRVSSKASIAKTLFANGYQLMCNRGLTADGEPKLQERRAAVAEEFEELSRRLRTIESLAADATRSAGRPKRAGQRETRK